MLMSMLHTEKIHTHTHARSAQGVGHMTIRERALFVNKRRIQVHRHTNVQANTYTQRNAAQRTRKIAHN